MQFEGEYGKHEMWHILDADEDAYIYVGFNRNVTDEELRQRIADNTLIQVLNKIPVKKDETYFLKAGTVHAIGAGCFLCEIQQSSNITYRLYDYSRKDKYGNLRQLHVDRALDVLDKSQYSPRSQKTYQTIVRDNYCKTLIGQCQYFTVNKYFINGKCKMPYSESSFQAFVFLSGEGKISDGVNEYPVHMGETWFCANKMRITIDGKCSLLVVNI
jgi:mannose-6-phosphate isomerase class I